MASSLDTNNASPATISVLFICLGNICLCPCSVGLLTNRVGRSPMAEAVFTHLIEAWTENAQTGQPVIEIDSAGTGGYHIGSSPDSRAMATLHDHGITKYRHAARQIKTQDFERFDYIIGMDEMNLRDLKRKARQAKNVDNAEAKISLFGSWEDTSSGGGDEIDDPYYGGDEGFETAFEQCVRFTRGWMRRVLDTDAVIDAHGKVTLKKVEASDT